MTNLKKKKKETLRTCYFNVLPGKAVFFLVIKGVKGNYFLDNI